MIRTNKFQISKEEIPLGHKPFQISKEEILLGHKPLIVTSNL